MAFLQVTPQQSYELKQLATGFMHAHETTEGTVPHSPTDAILEFLQASHELENPRLHRLGRVIVEISTPIRAFADSALWSHQIVYRHTDATKTRLSHTVLRREGLPLISEEIMRLAPDVIYDALTSDLRSCLA